MPILGSILPGLREVRAPLAAGYLWLTAAALFFIGKIPIQPNKGSFAEKVYAFASWLGPTATVAASSFLAYVIGILSVALSGAMLSWASRQQKRTDDFQELLGKRVTKLSDRGIAHLSDYVGERLATTLSDASGQPYTKTLNAYPDARAILAAISSGIELSERRSIISKTVETAPYIRAVVDDLPLIPNRLLGTEPEKFSVFDRQVSEGEFRSGLALPLLILGIAGATFVGTFWPIIAGVLGSSLLFMQARSRVIEAYDQLAEFVRSGSVVPATASEIDENFIRLTRTKLDADELTAFVRRASKAESAGQLDAAITWHRIPAYAGIGVSWEKVCDLTRTAKSGYRDIDLILEPLLVEGAQYSGRLALEALDSLITGFHHPRTSISVNSADEFESNMRWSIWLTALRALQHKSSCAFAERLVVQLYSTDASSEAAEVDWKLVQERKLQPVAFLTRHPPDDNITAGMLALLQPQLKTALVGARPPAATESP